MTLPVEVRQVLARLTRAQRIAVKHPALIAEECVTPLDSHKSSDPARMQGRADRQEEEERVMSSYSHDEPQRLTPEDQRIWEADQARVAAGFPRQWTIIPGDPPRLAAIYTDRSGASGVLATSRTTAVTHTKPHTRTPNDSV